jgi:hypothetical protein
MSERETTPPGTTTDSRQQPGGGASASTGSAQPDATTPEYSTRPVAFRRPDPPAGLLLVLAGVAAGISLLLDWLKDPHVTGLDLVRDGFGDLGGVFGSGLWQPLAIVLGGGVLFVLGVLLFLPARSHRTLGVLALLVSLAVVAAVLVPLADAGWDLGFFHPGFWSGIAVAVLGLLGALKALLTGPRYGTGAPRS